MIVLLTTVFNKLLDGSIDIDFLDDSLGVYSKIEKKPRTFYKWLSNNLLLTAKQDWHFADTLQV